MKRTTLLKELNNGESYTWGKVIEIYRIRDYAIIECHPWEHSNGYIKTGIVDITKYEYHPYVNDCDLSVCYDSFDAALAACIAYRNSRNTDAARYFMKMIY